jgi:hypothetical protein
VSARQAHAGNLAAGQVGDHPASRARAQVVNRRAAADSRGDGARVRAEGTAGLASQTAPDTGCNTQRAGKRVLGQDLRRDEAGSA